MKVGKWNILYSVLLGIITLSLSVRADRTLDYSKAMKTLRTLTDREHVRMTRTSLITELFEGIVGESQPYIDRFKEALLVERDEVGRENFNVSQECLDDAKQVIVGLERREYWAMQMLDAMAKPPSDILSGNIYWTGGYEECLAVDGTVYVNTTSDTAPQYQIQARQCLGSLQLGKLEIYLGFCIPRRCSVEDANRLVNTAFSVFSNTLRINGMVCPEVETEYDTKAIVSLLICSIIGLMMVIGTGYDVIIVRRKDVEGNKVSPSVHTNVDNTGDSLNESTSLLNKAKTIKVKEKDQGTLVKVLMSFSVMSNGERILSTAQAQGSLTALNGMRFLSITWVILGHCFNIAQTSPSINPVSFGNKVYHMWTFQAIANALVSVDTFFTMSGLLLAYLFMKDIKKSGEMNWPLFYFHRFWRLTPIYMLVLMMESNLTKYMGGDGGPVWPKDGIDSNCEKWWWTNLLYINNLFSMDKFCMPWSWYLSNDMQFFVISPLLLVPLYRKKFAGLVVCVVALFASLLTTGILSTHNEWVVDSMMPTVSIEESTNYFEGYYSKPWCRISPYIIGMMTGFALQECKCKFKINKWLNLLCWLIAAGVACSVLYGLYGVMTGSTISVPVASFYNTVNRAAWGACVCWVIFACATGNGGFVNTLLSWKAFVPLSRLSYAAYLIHLVFIGVIVSTAQYPTYTTIINQVVFFLGILVITFLGSFVVSLAFESPMMGLEKVVFPRKRR
ncbi:nose resistant to fluoxetine protein 6-like [Argopecten irradians]|uniref:nose resistant to fluoxetine protein 6-like n=1 Tax=Argopecten irradians TaxID=31199 RepID=UPI00371D05FE